MKSRRHVLAVLGATAIAGCAGQATDQPAGNETADEPAAEGETATDTVDDPHLDWAYGEDQQILEQVENNVDLDPVKNILEGDTDTHRKIGDALLQANTQYTQNQNYEHRHKTAVTTVQQAIQDLDLDITLTTFADWGKTPRYPSEGLDYSKVWVNDSDKDINVALNPAMRSPAYHIEGEQAQGDIQEILAYIRDSEVWSDRVAHDLEALYNQFEYAEEDGHDISEEQIKSAKEFLIDKFSNYNWREGKYEPGTDEDWIAFHDGIESGPNMIRKCNEAYAEGGYNGETAEFTIENGSVTMS